MILERLEEIEKKSKKNNMKWNKAKHDCRRKYLEELTKINKLKKKIFFNTFRDTKEYVNLTSLAASKAILKKVRMSHDYKVTVFIDGLRKTEINAFAKELRKLKVRTKKIRGVKKDENNAFIRLVDSICGLVRDAEDGKAWAKKILDKFNKRKIITSL